MQFQRLRLTGFKSFVDPTELYIEDGLTGIVGPNGCGKSNLLEALRWVMGETRPKNIRGEGMDDVIFAGTAFRPQRNLAEVTLLLDNDSKTAPAAFNDADQIEICRRIERESGSAYRLNGRETRARDVQLLFADMATGAHSPSLVSQGRIGTLINSKPKDRRMLLEEAAGISGLHSRRHEAELRLNAAKTNLERLDDLMAQIEAQLASLKRQARQASRYKSLSGRLRAAEALMLHLRWLHATQAREDAAQQLKAIETQVAERTTTTATASSAQAETAAKLPPLRDAEATAAAAAHRLRVEQENLDAEAQRLSDAIASVSARLQQTTSDKDREAAQAQEANTQLVQLTSEKASLEQDSASHTDRLEQARQAVESVAADTVRAEDTLDRLNEENAAANAQRNGLSSQSADLESRLGQLAGRLSSTREERDTKRAELGESSASKNAENQVTQARNAIETRQAAAETATSTREASAQQESSIRQKLDDARQALRAHQAEEQALAALLGGQDADGFAPVLDDISAAAGYEAALAAAFGDDLDLPSNDEAPSFWRLLPDASTTVSLPSGAVPLADHIKAPAELARALSQIGVVDTADGAALQPQLSPGQILVSAEGDAWRWDGKTVRAGARSAAAIRLEQRNRLETLRTELIDLEALEAEARTNHERAADKLDECAALEQEAIRQVRQAQDTLIEARNAQAALAHELAEHNSRVQSLDDTVIRLEEEISEASTRLTDAQNAFAALPPADSFAPQLAAARHDVEQSRNALAEAKAARDSLAREAQFRTNRLNTITNEQASWQNRLQSAQSQLDQLAERQSQAQSELESLQDKPDALNERREKLAAQIAEAEEKRQVAARSLAEAESDLSEKDQMMRKAEQALSEAREKRARASADADHAAERLDGVQTRIAEDLECRPEETLEMSGHKPDTPLPDLEEVSRRLDRLRRERDTMGPVNLRAEEEAEEIQEQLDTMLSEKEDLEAAINKLRHAIASLNREGRERLKAAFGDVNQHFSDLFSRLFGGGKAYLELTESDDPLEAGLEIYASPPGKRLQNMSLLSGGEQALTALSLIFAVFLTNPAPICVLDEVDAPLDDANVERFCGLLHDITAETGTRFLVVTHHPVTMSHLHRLFGVTMGEQGVSQLVSVDLGQAEQMIAAE